MSGIAVIWNRNGRPVDPEVLGQMTRAMEHRGPDREGHRIFNSIGLGHCLLATTPESIREEQPLVDEGGDLCLTFDGRIDNRAQLRSLLEGHGAKFRTDTDAELVLEAYRRWGEDSPAHLLGDFAFALWDARKRTLLCARDPLGVRPLFYASIGDTFVCASEIQPLFALAELKKKPNLAVVVCHLLKKYVEVDETIYDGIQRLPLAHRLIVTAEGIRSSRYWDIDASRSIRYRTDDEYAEHFRELFFEAVRCRMRSRGPVAGLLSGGLDSSGIVCTAQRIHEESGAAAPAFESFSMVFERSPRCDERPFINEVIRHCGATANLHVCDRDPTEAALERHVLHPDVPYNPQIVLIASMLRELQERNFHVMLDGTGGDELAGTLLNHLVTMMWRGKWWSIAEYLSDYSRMWDMPRWRLFMLSCLRPSIPPQLKALKRAIKPPAPAPRGPACEAAIDATGARAMIERTNPVPDFAHQRHREMYLGAFYGWGPTVATESYELLASYFGVEIRQPFRDRRLVEFAFALPPEQLWRDAWSRIAFRNAMKGIMPETVRLRRGKGMFVQLYDSVLAGSQAREVAALFENSTVAKLGVANGDVLQSIVRDYQANPDAFSTQAVSILVGLELQCRDIVGGGNAGSSERNRPILVKSAAMSADL